MLGSVVGSSRIERAAVRRLPRVRQRLAWTDMNFEFMKRAGKHRLIAYRQWDTEMNNRRAKRSPHRNEAANIWQRRFS